MPTYSDYRVIYERYATPDLLALGHRPHGLTPQARAALTDELFARSLYITSEVPALTSLVRPPCAAT